MIFKIAKEYLKHQKRNTITIIIVAVLSVILVTAVSTLKEQDYIERKEVYYKDNSEYSLILSATQKSAYDIIKNDSEINEVTVVGVEELNIDDSISSVATYDKEHLDKLLKVDMISGEMPKSRNEVIISEQYMGQLGGLITNDEIVINGENYNVVGIYRFKNPLNDEFSIIKIDNVINIINNHKRVKYYADYPIRKGLDFTIKEGIEATFNAKLMHKYNSLTWQIQQNEEGLIDHLLVSEEEYKKSIEVNSMISTLPQSVLIIFIAIFTVLAMKNAFSMSILSKVKLIGTLKAIGAEPKQIKKLIISEVIFLFLISLPIGILLGGLSSKIISYLTTKFLGYSIYNMSVFNIFYIILGSILMLGVAMLIASNDARNLAYKLTAVEAMTGSKSYKSDEFITGVNSEFINKHCNIEIILADKNISNNTKKYRICFLTLAIAMTLLAFMTNKLSISDVTAKTKYLYSNNWNVEMSSYKEFTKEKVDKVKNITNTPVFNQNEEELGILVPENKFQYNLKEMYGFGYNLNENGEIFFDLNKIYGNEDVINLCKSYIEDGEIDYNTYTEEDVILVNKAQLKLEPQNQQAAHMYRYEDITYYKVGDKIKLQDGKDYNIRAIISENPLSNIVVNSEGRNQINRMYAISLDKYSNIPSTKMCININDDNRDEIMPKLEAFCKENEYSIYNRESKVNKLNEINKKYALIDIVFVGSIVLILVVNLINTLTAAIVVRKCEIASLRAIGMAEKQVRKNIISEGVIVCIYSGVIGAMLSSIYLFFRKNEFLNQGGIKYNIVVLIILGVFVIQILIGILSSLKPLKTIMGSSIIEDIKD